MCDIWKANADKREISADDLERHIASIRRLRVRRVMLTGGEPLLHRNLWVLCDRLRAENIAVTLVTTGLLLEAHAADVVRSVGHVVVSIDGPPAVHDAIRRVRGGFERIHYGIAALRRGSDAPHVTARCVVQRGNHRHLVETVEAIRRIGADQLSFLGADITSPAFNRAEPWPPERQAEVALARNELTDFEAEIRHVTAQCTAALESEFVVGGTASLWRIYDYYCAVAGLREFPRARCNAPWVSAVLEVDGRVRPCFFHEPYPPGTDLHDIVNSPGAVAFRNGLDVGAHPTCQRCVCTLNVPAWRTV
jgi:MoaA/NifB/PqqE/SkfB family radical SAM enzyme